MLRRGMQRGEEEAALLASSNTKESTAFPASLSTSLSSLFNSNITTTTVHGTLCSWPDCTNQLGGGLMTFKFYCRRCNGSYCGEHAGHPAMRIKLDERGEWQPRGGNWHRVCQRCFTNRVGYSLPDPLPKRDVWEEFLAIREDYVKAKRAFKETLRERWQRLESYPNGTVDWSKWQRMIVEWQPDTSACSKCGDPFGPFLHRHHCRLCGRVICDECSGLLPILDKRVRVCSECKYHLNNTPTVSNTPCWPWLEELESIKRQMNQMMPIYWQRLRDLEASNDPQLLADAQLLRDTLLLQLRNLQSHIAITGDDDTLQKAICLANQKWAHERHCWLLVKPRMRPVPTQPVDIPTGLKSRTASSLLQSWFTPREAEHEEEEEEEDLPLPANFGTLMAQLEVLQEQRTNLNEQLDKAVKQRAWDQVTGLQGAMEEIDNEIDRLKRIICK